MPTYHTYNVIPTLPAALEPLREMVFNLWWTWEPSARRLFRHLDPELWNRTNHNPVRMLQLSRQARLVEVTLAPDAPVIGPTIRELDLPRDSTFVAVVREEHVVVPRGDTVFQAVTTGRSGLRHASLRFLNISTQLSNFRSASFFAISSFDANFGRYCFR